MAMEINDIVGGRGGFGYGGGCGDSGIGLIALLALLGRGRGLDGGSDGVAVGEQLNAVADGINHNINTSTLGILNQMGQGFDNLSQLGIMSKLGSIEGSIPLAAANVELAIGAAAANINTNTTTGFAITNKNINDAETAILASLCGVEKTVLQTAAVNLAATKDAQYAVTTAIRDDGDKTRAQAALYHEGNLQRELAVAQSALIEERHAGRIRDVEISVSNTATATQVQGQQQGQQQQQLQISSAILAALNNLAGDIQAVRQGQVIFNSGTMAASGTQAAANTKVA